MSHQYRRPKNKPKSKNSSKLPEKRVRIDPSSRSREALWSFLTATAQTISNEPDGAYYQILRDQVNWFNENRKTEYDPFTEVLRWNSARLSDKFKENLNELQ